MKSTYKIDVNTPHPNFLGSLKVAIIVTTIENNTLDNTTPVNTEGSTDSEVDPINETENNTPIIESISFIFEAESDKNHAINHKQNGTRSIHQNQFFIQAILYIIYIL